MTTLSVSTLYDDLVHELGIEDDPVAVEDLGAFLDSIDTDHDGFITEKQWDKFCASHTSSEEVDLGARFLPDFRK